MIESATRMLNKSLKREVETLGLYWFTQTKLRLVLLYTTVKGFTNQNLITKQVFCPATLGYTRILKATFCTILNSPYILENSSIV